jgi:hypothetical protein|tara:strand:+ start:734 stop:1348 length:615 start_codon:yes stop_codon:yes gene_type:complete
MGTTDFFMSWSLIFISMAFSFFMCGYTTKYLSDDEISYQENQEQKMIEYYELKNFVFKYEIEFEELESRDLSQNELNELKDKYIECDIPLNKVKMYYDSTQNAFCYYTKFGDVIYKYLQVVARKYVIEYDCKILFIEGMNIIEEKNNIVLDSCFSNHKFKKKEDVIKQEKKVNKYIRLGTFEDIKIKPEVKTENISFMDYFLNK